MRATWTRIAVVVGVVAAGVVAIRAAVTAPLPVDVGRVSRGPLRVAIRSLGQARVRDRHVVSAPVAGHLERISLREGAAVAAGAVVARIRPATPPLLDVRERSAISGRLEVARAVSAEATTSLERARLASTHARRELERLQKMASQAQGAVTPQALESAEFAAQSRAHDASLAEAALRTAERQVETARSALLGGGAGSGEVAVIAPASGRVLRVLHQSEGPVAQGTPLLALGDTASLEIVADLLTTEAVQVRPGVPAVIEGWGGPTPLAGRVSLVEPSAFTKTSALGVEEQRVNIHVDISGQADGLSDGFRVEVSIVSWEATSALRVPVAALFRDGAGWAVLVVDGGRCSLRRVTIGHQSVGEAEVLDGLREGEAVILSPDDKLGDGARVSVR